MKSLCSLKYKYNKSDHVTLRQGLISAHIRFLKETLYKNSFKIFTRHPSAERKQPKIKLNLFFQQVNSFSCIFLSSFSKFTGFYLIVYLLNSRSILEKTRWLIQS